MQLRATFFLPWLCAALAVSALAGLGQEDVTPDDDIASVNVDIQMRVSPSGAVAVTDTRTFSAAQFRLWQDKYGQDKLLLKRDMNRSMSRQETSDWDVTVKEMDRTVIMTFKILGMMSYQGNGLFEMRVPKGWIGGERTGNVLSYHCINPAQADEPPSYTTIALTLPDRAANVQDAVADDGSKLLRYELIEPHPRGWMFWSGVACLGIGAIAIAGGFFIRSRTAAAA